MKCTQKQFEEIREVLQLLSKNRLGVICNFENWAYLFNNYTSIRTEDVILTNRKLSDVTNEVVYNEWNTETFLKACGIVESEPTTKVRNSVLLQLADNNSFSEEIIRKECPKLFESEIKIGDWISSKINKKVAIKITDIKDTELFGYGINYKGEWIDEKVVGELTSDLFVLKPQEVENALINEAKKRGFKVGVEFITPINEFLSTCNEIFTFDYDRNSLFNNSMAVFCDGKWSKITTPTDIITIFEKYGKDELQKYLDNYKK